MIECMPLTIMCVKLASGAFPLRLLSSKTMLLLGNVASVPLIVLAPAVPELPMQCILLTLLYGLMWRLSGRNEVRLW